jgi:hypothetical protein
MAAIDQNRTKRIRLFAPTNFPPYTRTKRFIRLKSHLRRRMNTQSITKLLSGFKGVIPSLIIGLSIIIGLNLQWCIDTAADFYSTASGEKARLEEARVAAYELERRETAEQAQFLNIWDDFLKKNFNGKQYGFVTSDRGDYMCYNPDRSYPGEELVPVWDGSKFFYKRAWPKSKQQIDDEMLDNFISYLNMTKFLDRNNWVYDDIDIYEYKHIFQYKFFKCRSPYDAYRRNRFKQRIDLKTDK